jgi:hypothetical protein
MTIPTYLPYFVFTGTAATLAAILYGLNRALATAAWPAPERRRTVRLMASVLLGWLAAAIGLAARWASIRSMRVRSPRFNTASLYPS